MKHNKYEPLPELIVDLHGMTTKESQVILDQILESVYRHVRIIVGKGTRSESGPVLPVFVKQYLAQHNINFRIAKLQNGGEGALEVFL